MSIKPFVEFVAENINSVYLTVVTGIFYGFSLEQAHKYGEIIFTYLSIISVAMLIIINLKKLLKALRDWATKDKI